MSTEISKLTGKSKELNKLVDQLFVDNALIGFERAFVVASVASEIKNLLTSDYMKPIMSLQGSKIGFKTDKDASGGYPEPVVKACLIEAVLTGVQPIGNHFNIISGNCYITKEGFKYLLDNKVHGLSQWEVICDLPRIKDGSAACVANITWVLNGKESSRQIDLPIKVNAGMGADAVIGKATRKARAWLYNTVSGKQEIPDGDIQDVEAKIVSTTVNKSEERITHLINDATTLKEIQGLESRGDLTEEHIVLIEKRKSELSK